MIQHSPAAERNLGPISDILAQVLPAAGVVLEVASGTGQHAAGFSARFPSLRWLPSDPSETALASIRARRAVAGLPNLAEPILLDVRVEAWPIAEVDAIFCANMIHIAAWEATVGLFRGASRHLPVGAPLVLYGPYLERGVETAASNEAFDGSLRARDPSWGLRWLHEVEAAGAARGFARVARFPMPANNLIVVFRKPSAG